MFYAGKFARCRLPSCTVHLFDRRPPASAWRLIVAASDLPQTSPYRDAWPSPTVADALSTSLSRPCRRNCKILSNVLLRCTGSRHTLNAECSRQVFNSTVYGQVEKVVLKVIEPTQCRRRGTITTVNVAYIRCCRRRTDNQQSTLL